MTVRLRTDHAARHRHRALAGSAAIAAAAALVVSAGGVDGSASHAQAVTGERSITSRQALTQQASIDGAQLDLVGQTFAVEAEGELRFDYVLRELDGDPLELATTTTSTTTTTSVPTTVAGELAGDGAPATDTATTTTVAPPPRLVAEIVNYAPLTDPDDIAAIVGSHVDPAVFDTIGAVIDGVAIDARPLAVIDDGGDVSFTFDVGTDVDPSVGDRLKFERPGLYPVRIQLVTFDGADDDIGRVVATAGTIVQRLASATDQVAPPPIDLAVVVATPELAPEAPADAAQVAGDAFDAAISFAGDFAGSAAFRLPPQLVSDAAATVAGADELAIALADDELVPSPAVPLDVSSAVAADRADTYTRLVISGEDLLSDAVSTTPTRRDLWIASSPVSGPGAQLLRDLGTRFIVMTDDVYRDSIGPVPTTDQFVAAELPDGGSLPVIVVDPLGADLTAAATTAILGGGTATEWAVATIAAMLVDQAADDLELVASGGTPAERGRILATPDLSAPDARLLDALVAIADTTPSVRFATATSLTGVTDLLRVDGEPFRVELPATAGPSLTDRVALLESTAFTMASVATMLPADDPRPAAWSTELEALVSTAYSDADVLAATAEMQAEAARLRSSVVLPEPFTFTLTGRTGTIEVRLTNTADEPLTVLVGFTSTKLTFPDGDQTVTLRAASETSVVVPVAARANGTSSIDLTVSTPAGEPLGDPVPLTATVTALTGLGQVLTAGLVLVLATWWFTHWRSRRRAAALADGRDDAPDPGAPQDAATPTGVESESL